MTFRLWRCFEEEEHSYSVPTFQQDDKVQSRPCNFGRDRKKLGMLLTKKHVCYNCPNHLQPSRFGTDNHQLSVQCLQAVICFLLDLEFNCTRCATSGLIIAIFGQNSS